MAYKKGEKVYTTVVLASDVMSFYKEKAKEQHCATASVLRAYLSNFYKDEMRRKIPKFRFLDEKGV